MSKSAPKTQVPTPPPSPGFVPDKEDPIEPPSPGYDPKDAVVQSGVVEETAKSVTDELVKIAEKAMEAKEPETPAKKPRKKVIYCLLYFALLLCLYDVYITFAEFL